MHRASGVIVIAGIVADVTSTAVMAIAGIRVAAEVEVVPAGISASSVAAAAAAAAEVEEIGIAVMAVAVTSVRVNCPSLRKASV